MAEAAPGGHGEPRLLRVLTRGRGTAAGLPGVILPQWCSERAEAMLFEETIGSLANPGQSSIWKPLRLLIRHAATSATWLSALVVSAATGLHVLSRAIDESLQTVSSASLVCSCGTM